MPRSGAAPDYRPLRGWRPARTGAPIQLRLLQPDRKCELRCYPRDDRQFEANAVRALAESRELSVGWNDLLAHFRTRMAKLHPNLLVQPRDPLAARNEGDQLWYCYRDGRLLPAVVSGTTGGSR